MKKLFMVANWKSNLTSKDALSWLTAFQTHVLNTTLEGKEIILCPSFPLLSVVFAKLQELPNLPIILGAQDVSPFASGPYTGAVNAEQIKEYTSYVLIGHSERRTYFYEDEKELAQKVAVAGQFGLQSIFFMQNEQTPVPANVTHIVYEPPSSISPGKPDTPENANAVAQAIKKRFSVPVLYGGNVTQENVNAFTHMADLDGVVVGRASLSPESFAAIVTYA